MEHRLNAEVKTDEVLMTRLCQGDDSALAELVRRYQHDILRFCLHYLKQDESSREMTQETFVRVFTARHRFDASRKFRPWLLCIARNLCLNELKRKKAVSMEALEEYASSARDGCGELLRFPGDGPDELLMADERRELLERALDTLGADARELIALRFFQKMSARDIAELVGTTEGAVRTRICRILASLRDKYSGCGDEL